MSFPFRLRFLSKNFRASQTLSFSGKRSASGTLLCEQSKMARMSMEVPPTKAVPEVVRIRPTPQSAPCTAVPEGVRNRAPPPPEGTVARTANVTLSTVGPTARDGSGRPATSAGRSLCEPASERTRTNAHQGNGSYLRKSVKIQVGISELEYLLRSPGKEAISMTAFAESARDEFGYGSFAVIDTSRGMKWLTQCTLARRRKRTV